MQNAIELYSANCPEVSLMRILFWSLQNRPCAVVTRGENSDLNFESEVSKLLLQPFFPLLLEKSVWWLS
jgi:hypothetical protein